MSGPEEARIETVRGPALPDDGWDESASTARQPRSAPEPTNVSDTSGASHAPDDPPQVPEPPPAEDALGTDMPTSTPVIAGRPAGQLALVAAVAGVLAALLGVTDLATPWAVLLGTGVGLASASPALPRGVALLAGGVVGWGAAAVHAGAVVGEAAVVTGAGVAGLVLIAGLAAYLSRERVAPWAAVLGAAAVLVGTDRGATPPAVDVVTVLAGLAAGVAAVVVAETVSAWRRRPPAPADASQDDEVDPVEEEQP